MLRRPSTLVLWLTLLATPYATAKNSCEEYLRRTVRALTDRRIDPVTMYDGLVLLLAGATPEARSRVAAAVRADVGRTLGTAAFNGHRRGAPPTENEINSREQLSGRGVREQFVKQPLLIIDDLEDLTTELNGRPAEDAVAIFQAILTERLRARKPTLILVNDFARSVHPILGGLSAK